MHFIMLSQCHTTNDNPYTTWHVRKDRHVNETIPHVPRQQYAKSALATSSIHHIRMCQVSNLPHQHFLPNITCHTSTTSHIIIRDHSTLPETTPTINSKLMITGGCWISRRKSNSQDSSEHFNTVEQAQQILSLQWCNLDH